MFRHKSTHRYRALSCCTLRFAFEFASGAAEPPTLPEHLRPDPFGEVVQADRMPGLAPAKGILLEGARTAFVSCHLIVKIPRQGAYRLPVIPFAASSGLQAELYREWYHHLPKTGKYYPDALVPVAEAVQSKLSEPDNRIDARTAQGYWLDVWIEGNGRKKRITDWTLFDHRYGPLLDGTAFAKTHRGSRPIQLVYLPFKPEWPASYLWWGEPGYEREFVNVVPAMERHFREKGWTNTRFEMFFNHKKRYKDGDVPYLRDAGVDPSEAAAERGAGRDAVERVSRDAADRAAAGRSGTAIQRHGIEGLVFAAPGVRRQGSLAGGLRCAGPAARFRCWRRCTTAWMISSAWWK